jgi:hypothetical protein
VYRDSDGHIPRNCAAPFDWDGWVPPPFAYRVKGKGKAAKSIGRREIEVESEEEDDVEVEENEEVGDAGGSGVEDTAPSDNETMDVDEDAPPIAVLEDTPRPKSGAKSSSKRGATPFPSNPSSLFTPEPDNSAPPRSPRLDRAQFSYRPADLFVPGPDGPLPQPRPENERARNDDSFPVPPESCFGAVRPYKFKQENHPPEVAAQILVARMSWILWHCVEQLRVAVWVTGREFMMALLQDTVPRLSGPPANMSLPLVYGGIPYPCPVPSISSDEDWRVMVLHHTHSLSHILRDARAVATADREGKIRLGEGRELAENMPTGWNHADLFRYLAKDEATIKAEFTDPSVRLLPFLPPLFFLLFLSLIYAV